MAQLAAKGKLKVGDDFVHESIIGSLFRGRVEAAATVGGRPAIVPSIAGWARQTGINTIFIDDRDPSPTASSWSDQATRPSSARAACTAGRAFAASVKRAMLGKAERSSFMACAQRRTVKR